MGDFAEISMCGVKPFHYPAQAAEGIGKGLSKAWDVFSRHVVDIPEFPVQGNLIGQGHWKIITVNQQTYHLDTSTGIVYAGPGVHDCFLPRIKAVEVILMVPLYAVGTVLYNVVKIIPTIIYLAGHIFYAYYTQEEGDNHKSLKAVAWDHAKDMGFETWASFRNIIRTPFFAVGMLFGALWAIVDPLNGVKIIGSFEFHWNHRKTIFGPTLQIIGIPSNFKFKNLFVGGSYFLAPCMSYVGVVKVDHDGEILDRTLYKVPEDLTDFRWNDLTSHGNIVANAVDQVGRCIIPCCCLFSY